MKRSAKNYFCLLMMAASLYFLFVTMLHTEELRQLALESGTPQTASSIWFVLAAIEGLLFAFFFCYFILSRQNKLTFRQTARKSGTPILIAGSAAGLGLGLASNAYLSGSLENFNLADLFPKTQNPVASADSSEESQSEESMEEQTPIPELPPVATGADLVASMSGVVTVNDEQSITEDCSATQNMQAAILVDEGGNATVNGADITKSGDAEDPSGSLDYGLNAGVFIRNGGSLNMTDGSITTSANGAPGLAAIDTSNVTLNETTITTEGDNSEGLYCGSGSSITDSNPSIVTNGQNAPAVILRKNGYIMTQSGTMQTNGENSPLFSGDGQAFINYINASSAQSAAAVLNQNSILNMQFCTVRSGTATFDEQKPAFFYVCKKDGLSDGITNLAFNASTISAADPSAAASAPVFLIDGVECNIVLVYNTFPASCPVLAKIEQSDTTLDLQNQQAAGQIQADAKSKATIKLTKGTRLTTAINSDNSGAEVSLELDADSVLVLNGDCYVNELKNENTANSNIITNGYTLYVKGQPLAAANVQNTPSTTLPDPQNQADMTQNPAVLQQENSDAAALSDDAAADQNVNAVTPDGADQEPLEALQTPETVDPDTVNPQTVDADEIE